MIPNASETRRCNNTSCGKQEGGGGGRGKSKLTEKKKQFKNSKIWKFTLFSLVWLSKKMQRYLLIVWNSLEVKAVPDRCNLLTQTVEVNGQN